MTTAILCEKCGAYLIEASREQVDNEHLVKFEHTSEQNTNCDGYFQCKESQFDEYGVEETLSNETQAP